MYHLRFPKLMLSLMVPLLAVGCKPASYEFIGAKSGRKTPANDVPQAGFPSGDNPSGQDLPPAARVEVMLGGVSVTRVYVGDPTQIQPSADTGVPGMSATPNCPNPGIRRADYTSGDGATPFVQRTQGCEPLAVPHTWTQVGDYNVTLAVTTASGKRATASMLLHVVDRNNPDNDEGFTITANPLITVIAQPVAFGGICKTALPNTVSWQFGDGSMQEGINVSHPYAQTGQYTVNATCTTSDGKARHASVTIDVIASPDGNTTAPPTQVDPMQPRDPWNPSTPPSQCTCSPTQGAVQDPWGNPPAQQDPPVADPWSPTQQ